MVYFERRCLVKLPLLSVVLLQEGELWVAVSLEVFFAAQAQTIAAALRELLQLIQRSVALDGQFQNQPFALDERAPDYYWDKFRSIRRRSCAH